MAFRESAMLALLVASGLLHIAAATQYEVGAALGGWVIPPANSPSYSSEFTGKTLHVGDTLLFPFQTGAHNVYEVSSADYTSCTGTSPINKYTQTNATVTLATSGTHSYICDLPGHCTSGMKLQVTVSGSAPAPAPGTKAPVPAPGTKAPAPAPGSPVRGKGPSPAPSTSPGKSSASGLQSGIAVAVASFLACCAVLWL